VAVRRPLAIAARSLIISLAEEGPTMKTNTQLALPGAAPIVDGDPQAVAMRLAARALAG